MPVQSPITSAEKSNVNLALGCLGSELKLDALIMVNYRTVLLGVHSEKKAMYRCLGASSKLLFPVGHKTPEITGNESWVISTSWYSGKNMSHLLAAGPS